jgi:hypothetical protein
MQCLAFEVCSVEANLPYKVMLQKTRKEEGDENIKCWLPQHTRFRKTE